MGGNTFGKRCGPLSTRRGGYRSRPPCDTRVMQNDDPDSVALKSVFGGRLNTCTKLVFVHRHQGLPANPNLLVDGSPFERDDQRFCPVVDGQAGDGGGDGAPVVVTHDEPDCPEGGQSVKGDVIYRVAD